MQWKDKKVLKRYRKMRYWSFVAFPYVYFSFSPRRWSFLTERQKRDNSVIRSLLLISLVDFVYYFIFLSCPVRFCAQFELNRKVLFVLDWHRRCVQENDLFKYNGVLILSTGKLGFQRVSSISTMATATQETDSQPKNSETSKTARWSRELNESRKVGWSLVIWLVDESHKMKQIFILTTCTEFIVLKWKKHVSFDSSLYNYKYICLRLRRPQSDSIEAGSNN